MKKINKIYMIIGIIWITIFSILISKILSLSPSKNTIVFSYPKWEINFAWEILPTQNDNYFIKERFDKEFLNTSYNLYQFFLYVKRLPLYMPFIEDELKKAWVPDDFKYLPIAESALKNDVVSWAWAGWMWQFMPDTAKQYGLIVNDEIDERYNFKKSTTAAIKHISDLHKTFKDWTLVAASYNRWATAIKNALKDQNVSNYYDLYLNEETSRYVFKIISIKYVITDYYSKKAYIDKLIGWTYELPETESIKVWKIDDLKSWSHDLWQNYQTIKELNPWILKDYLPDWNWEVSILKK